MLPLIKKIAVTLLLLGIINTCVAQSISAQATIRKYNTTQKRLLVISTAQFINFLTQSNLDQDSVMVIARRVTGMPFFLPTDGGLNRISTSRGTELINQGKILEGAEVLKGLSGELRIQLLLQLGYWYLHQPGTYKKDLDSAGKYLNLALKQTKLSKSGHWKTECLFLQGEWYAQRGDVAAGKLLFSQIAKSAAATGDRQNVARAWHQLGKLLPYSDPKKLQYFNNACAIYKQLKLIEKEIELLGDLADCHDLNDKRLEENDYRKILALQRSIGFKHTLFIQNQLAYILGNQAKYADAANYAAAALKSMQWSGIKGVSGNFYIRLGSVDWSMGKKEQALLWFKKAMDGTQDNHLFWYKSLFYASSLLDEMNRPREFLSLINKVTAKFPPVTLWEKMQVLSCRGLAYEKLKNVQAASTDYLALLDLANKNPLADPFHELDDTYISIAMFYISQHDLKTARLFLKKVQIIQSSTYALKSLNYKALFKIDSLLGHDKSALWHYKKYVLYRDSDINLEQQNRFNDQLLKSAAEKKDRDIKLLNQEKKAQKADYEQSKLIRNLLAGGAALLLIFLALLFYQFLLKQRANRAINQKNKALQHLLTEKEWLLKEVHHRVKNNLHTVICLLESQAAYLENDARQAIQNSQHRIYAMSLIHQKLYQADDIQTVDMSVYLPDIVSYLGESFGTIHQIRFELAIEPIILGVSYAVPLSLIINEVVTNAIKHAFPNQKKGVITIKMKENDELIELVIADNGIGIQNEQIRGQAGSLGLKLLHGLSEDINAAIDIENNNGTTITIKFKIDELMYPAIV